jgi:tetratricopeptide (TPR) repeat protein
MAVLALALLGAASGAARAQQGDESEERTRLAKEQFLRGKQRYADRKYADAIQSFRAAAALQPSPILDYNIGRCHEMLGQLDEAIAAFRRYLDGKKDAANRAEVKARIQALRARKRAARQPAASDPYEDLERSQARRSPAASAPASRPAVAAARPAGADEPGAPRRPAAAAAGDDLPHEAALPSSWGRAPAAATARPAPPASPAPPRTPGPPPAPGRRDEGPVYKQWWFWVAIVGGAAIAGVVIATAVGSSSSSPRSHTSGLRF